MASTDREYELVLLGATGYTGKYCAEHIATHLPTDLRWAVAGRNESKLSALIKQVEPLNPDRRAPGVEVASLSPEDVDTLTKKTQVLISTVGPFHLYGTPVIEACVRNGTHYIDSTGESPWVLDMLRQHQDTAKKNKAIIMPQCGLESAPSDLIAWSLVSFIRKQLSVGTKDAVATAYNLTTLPSGGTLATVFSIFDFYPVRQIAESTKPYSLSAIPGRKAEPEPFLTRLTGVRHVPDLGTLTTGVFTTLNMTLVNRSWSLFDGGNFYGPNFQYKEYMSVRNSLTGLVVHYALLFGMASLALPPVRWLVKKLVHQPGEGTSRESAAKDRIEYRAIATADTKEKQRAYARFCFGGGAYHLTGVLMAEAAITILRDNTAAHGMGGGFLTPATLGQAFIDRLGKAGASLATHMLDH